MVLYILFIGECDLPIGGLQPLFPVTKGVEKILVTMF